MNNSENEKAEELPAIQRMVLEKYGEVNSSYDASYVLSDGKLLAKRGLDILDDLLEQNLLDSGAIKFSRLKFRTQEAVHAFFCVMPTKKQVLVLKQVSVGVYSVSLTFADINTKEAVGFKGKSLDTTLFLPDEDALDKYFDQVKQADIFKSMSDRRI